MNSRLFESLAVLFIIFICIVANMSNTKTLSNKFISIFLLVAVVATILASSKNNNTLENFVVDPEKEQERIKELEKALVGRIDERDKLRLKQI